ncbi:MAG: 6-bladed beta-propeller, partial [Phycisphaerales bacterium]
MTRTLRALLRTACLAGLSAGLAACAAPRAENAGGPQPSYAFWPQFPDAPRIQLIRSFGSSDDLASTRASALERVVFGKEADTTEWINKPYGVAMKGGRIYVCDMRAKALTVLDLRKRQTRLVGVTGMNPLEHPVAVAVADDGTIYVADNAKGAVLVYDASERYARAIGFPKFKPVSLAVHGERLYACDLAGQAVQVFDRRDGRRLASIGTVGDGDGQFRVPLGVAADKDGNIYVVDMMQCRVQKFSPDGTFLSALGAQGDYAGSFARPKHLAVDSAGIIYVVDATFQNVQMFDDQHRLLMHFGAPGNFPGAMDLPAGIAVSDEGLDLVEGQVHPGFKPTRLVAVTNQFGHAKVSLYALGELRPGFTPQDLAPVAARVDPGVETPAAARLRHQTPRGGDPRLPGA